MIVGEVRLGTESEDAVCEIVRFDADEHLEPICTLRAKPDEGQRRVVTGALDGRPVVAEPLAAVEFAGAIMAELAGGRVPNIDELLSEHLGLTRPPSDIGDVYVVAPADHSAH